MRYFVFILTGLTVSLCLSGCNTMEGMGKDVKKGGENLEKAADKHK